MAYEAGHTDDYPETAGWALGTLDAGDRAGFAEHLRACEYCQAQVAGFTPVAKILTMAAPAAEPAPDLELKVGAAVQYAVMAESAAAAVPAASATGGHAVPRPAPTARAHRWWHLHRVTPLQAALAAAAVAAVVTATATTGGALLRSAPAPAATFSLRAQPGFTGSATATATKAQGGFTVTLTVKNLPVPGPGQFYECWYAGPDNHRGHPQLVTAGTFTVRDPGSLTLSMWSAADPAKFKIMQVTLEQPEDASQHGEVILAGAAQP